jgi:hypothetical protein
MVSTTRGDDMTRDADTPETPDVPDASDAPDAEAATTAPVTTSRFPGGSIARAARLLVTPGAIVAAWAVVVTQWNESDTELFNWATVTTGIVLGVVTIAWLVSLRFPALRRALLPIEGGLAVGAVVLAVATSGREVDMLSDRIAIAVVFGIIAALLLGFTQQLVAGRRRAGAWLGGIAVACAAAGIVVPATLDWLEGPYSSPAELDFPGEVVGRSTPAGFRLDDVTLEYTAPTLGSGYIDDAAAMSGMAFAEPALAIDPATGEPIDDAAAVAVPVDAAAPAIASPTDAAPPAAPSMPAGAPSAATSAPMSGPVVRSDWAQLYAQPDGSIRLAVQSAVGAGVDGAVRASLRQDGCRTAHEAKELLSLELARSSRGTVERTLPTSIDDLRIDDQLSVVIGTAKPLAPTRCIELLSPTGIALAQLGAARFGADCMAELGVPRGDEYLVQASSFQDPTCAKRFEEYRDVSTGLLVTKAKVGDFHACRRSRERAMATTERELPHGAIAVRYDDLSTYGDCAQYAVNAMSLGGYAVASTTYANASPAPVPYATPVPTAPLAPGAPSEDLDGLTPEEVAAKIR